MTHVTDNRPDSIPVLEGADQQTREISGAGNAERHDMAVTHRFWDSLPQSVRDHLVCPVADELQPIYQKHTIEGLMMGDA